MFESLENIDRDIFLFLNGLHAPFLDQVMYQVSRQWLWIPLYLFILWYTWRKTGWKGLLFLVCGSAVCVLLTDQICNLFKNSVERYRPTHNSEIGSLVHTVIAPSGEEYRGGLYTFFSGHAAGHMAIATLVFMNLKKYSQWWTLLFGWALLIGYSRIYLGVHYPSDVFCGFLCGGLVASTVFLAIRFIRHKLESK